MTRRQIRWIKKLTITLGAGVLFGSMTCVRTVADTVGTGLTVGGVSGLLGPNSQTATDIGVALDVLADIIRYSPIGH